MFLPVDSIAFVFLTTITCPILSALVPAFLRSKHPTPAKTKGRLKGRLHSDAQVKGQRNRKCIIVLVSRTAYLFRVSYYLLYSLGFPLFTLPAFRVSGGIP